MLWHYYAIPLLLLTATLKQSASQDESGGIEYGRMREGDIKLTDEQEQSLEALSNSRDPNAPQNAVVRNEQELWPGAVVPYELDDSLNSRARTAIAEAVADYATQTCVRFVERRNEIDYVRIFPGDGCFSYVGRITGPQDMSIGRGCEYKGTVIHEMFHALGRWHEQSRPDRDQFVRILTDNIESGNAYNFDIANPAFVTTQGIPYDIGSIMHYSYKAFSRNGRPTILPIDRDISPTSLGQRDELSNRDIQHVQTLYCGGGRGGSWSSWSRWSSCSRTCNGGTLSRTRTCVGGTDCDGSNVDTQRCNTNSCSVVASWGSWSRWSGCSNTCGGGRQTRTRRCIGGNNCVGRETQFQDCSTQNCPIPASWASWGSWSSCSSTCQGGFRQRRRFCRNGKNCPGTDIQSAYCNRDIPCQPNPNNGEWSSWSTCTAECGGGSRFRTRYCEDSQSNCVTEIDYCNEEDCVPEPDLTGLRYRGCWYLNSRARKLGSFEKTTPDLSDDATTRVRPVSKCGKAVQEEGYEYFGIATGYCFSGSNDLDDYQYYASSLCRNGRGAYSQKNGGSFLMDVYQIYDAASFSDSIIQLDGGNNTTTTTDMMMTTTGSGYALTYNLVLLVSAILTVVLSMAVM